ncbi:hypothetical protein [Nocardiopsis suaedae]|uniref:Uncharacterized protein n=1 Tax=Nocardiopsis suaedae TaxID=3018444 RepID=A0ABT4TM62_9ACTN|nr:hypothetical protein [Nocardiopsis suaedae]MDA2805461.1 hypothetical protein [Nocardiopsis suaedae]
MLRQLLTFLAGLALAPAVWFGTAWAADTAPQASDTVPLGVLMAAGAAGGFLVGVRIPPVGSLACGLPLLAYALWPVVAPHTVSDWIPGGLARPDGPALPFALVLGTLLVIAALSPSRWRRDRRSPAPAPAPPPTADPAPPEGPPPPGAVPPPAEPAGPAAQGADPERTTIPFSRKR